MPGAQPDRLPSVFRMTPKQPLGVQPENPAAAGASTWPGNTVGRPARPDGSSVAAPDPTVAPPASPPPSVSTAAKGGAESWRAAWKTRPSWSLFHRSRPATPPAEGGSSSTLARFFPSLSAPRIDQAKLGLGRDSARPATGDAPSPRLNGSTVETTSAAANDAPSVLAAALQVQAYPKTPSPVLPGPASEPLVASRDASVGDPFAPRPRPADLDARSQPVDAAPVLASHEAPAPATTSAPAAPADSGATTASATAPKPDLIDSLDSGLQVEPGAIKAATMDATSGVEPTDVAPAAPAEAPRGATRQPLRSVEDPELSGRPRLGPGLTMPLPAVEYPRTYYSESKRMAARERPPIAVDYPIESAKRGPLFPRLTKLFGGAEPGASAQPAAASAP